MVWLCTLTDLLCWCLSLDVLVYTSAVLDKLVAVTGRMWCYLYVSSNATDTDFMVKVR